MEKNWDFAWELITEHVAKAFLVSPDVVSVPAGLDGLRLQAHVFVFPGQRPYVHPVRHRTSDEAPRALTTELRGLRHGDGQAVEGIKGC